MFELLTTIEHYWTKRAPSYSDYILKTVDNDREALWANKLISSFPPESGRPLRVLDIGTGPGYFAFILAKRGFDVTAVDYSEGMLELARQNAGVYGEAIDFARMDAHCLDFDDESFDVIVTRNLTWNLEDPARAYADWFRVLRPGGRLLNYDANWYAYLFDEQKRQAYEQDRINTAREGVTDNNYYEDGDIMEAISRNLPLGRMRRPQWDAVTLVNIGFSKFFVDTVVDGVLLDEEEKINFASTPGFLICAEK